ncbi:hypothetical protein H0H93_013855, partial [Arthromyces matolae]
TILDLAVGDSATRMKRSFQLVFGILFIFPSQSPIPSPPSTLSLPAPPPILFLPAPPPVLLLPAPPPVLLLPAPPRVLLLPAPPLVLLLRLPLSLSTQAIATHLQPTLTNHHDARPSSPYFEPSGPLLCRLTATFAVVAIGITLYLLTRFIFPSMPPSTLLSCCSSFNLSRPFRNARNPHQSLESPTFVDAQSEGSTLEELSSSPSSDTFVDAQSKGAPPICLQDLPLHPSHPSVVSSADTLPTSSGHTAQDLE